MKLVRLAADYPLQSFDCGDEDLNENDSTRLMYFDMLEVGKH